MNTKKSTRERQAEVVNRKVSRAHKLLVEASIGADLLRDSYCAGQIDVAAAAVNEIAEVEVDE